MEGLHVMRVLVGPVGTNCYILFLAERNDCLVIDPGDNPSSILQAADGRRIDAILFTHGHFDHIAGGKGIMGENTRVYIHALDADMLSDPEANASRMLMGMDVTGPAATDLVQDGDTIRAAGLELQVLHTPGHTRGSVCYLVKGGVQGTRMQLLFTGDTIMSMGYGRTDLPGGSAEDMRKSLEKLHPYCQNCQILGGHG